MKRISAGLVPAAFAGIFLAIAIASVARTSAQKPDCGGPLIRKQAVTVARSINTAQMRSLQTKSVYQPLSALRVTIPEGLDVQLVHSPAAYVFSVKDTREVCRFTLFSDQDGLIYIAQPLQ